MISGTFSFFSGDSLRVENESKIFQNVDFFSYDHSFDDAVIILSDGHCSLEFQLFILSNKSEKNRTFSHQYELVI